MVKKLHIDKIYAHPRNPRISPRKDIVDQIAAQIIAGMDDSHALIVRPTGNGEYQIVSGHHRWLAGKQAGLTELPCWVREMSDEDAYMQLVLCNTQSELHPLEEGIHAIGSGMKQADYVREIGKAQQTVSHRWRAAEVFTPCGVKFESVKDSWRNLAEIHSAPRWAWSALVERMAADGWTVELTRKAVAVFKQCDEPAAWIDADAVAAGIVSGVVRISDIGRMHSIVDAAMVRGRFRDALMDDLSAQRPKKLSDVQSIVSVWEERQANHDAEVRRKELEAQLLSERAAERIGRLRANCSLDEWKGLSTEERASLIVPAENASGSFNKQENDSIEWAQWSWNPVTGCRHECPYCYARDIALSQRMEKVYPNGFEPTFRSNALNAPRHTKVPKEADRDTRLKNVFTCSMADLFGRWVPSEWIEAVFQAVRDNPQWNFLFLTKFPKRMAEFEIPKNAWMGTTVDLQARAQNAETAFAKVKSGVRWLSVEPMLEPLKFSRLDLFDWVVIGGASRSQKTPEWHPPFEWVANLVEQCRSAGTKVYFKTNLLGNRIIELPFDAPVIADAFEAPEIFRYLDVRKEAA